MPPELPNDSADSRSLKGRVGLLRIFYAAGYSRDGLIAAVRCEAAFRQLLLLNLILIPLALMLEISKVERAMLVAVVMLTLIVELLNSAIEATVDRISLALHPLSKQAKDMGSAAQLLALVLVGLVWMVILL